VPRLLPPRVPPVVPAAAWSAALALLSFPSLSACTTSHVAEPADATAPADAGSNVRAAAGPAAPEPSGPGATPRAPAAAKPTQPFNCQAPLVVIEEVTRLLTVASTHATRSAACVDGPGQRVTIDEILVCPLRPDGPRRPFGVTYRVTTWDESGGQICAGKCPPVVPEHTYHRIDVTFGPRPHKDGHAIEPPTSLLPGLPPDATPVTAVHDGDCYGPSPAFEPRPIPLR
jgi:hypothetical protein